MTGSRGGSGRFVVSQQQPDGSVLQYWQRYAERSLPGVFGQFSTGEAFYAMALLDRSFPGEGWDRPGAPGRRLPGDAPRRGRGRLPRARPLGGIRARGRLRLPG